LRTNLHLGVPIKRKNDEPVQVNSKKDEVNNNTAENEGIPSFTNPNSSGSFPPLKEFLSDLGTWSTVLKNFTESPKMDKIYKFVSKEYNHGACYPPRELIFNAFKIVPWSDIKVVILGQDPYPNVGEVLLKSFKQKYSIK